MERRRIMPGVKRVSGAGYRVPVQKVHLVDVRVRLRTKPADARAVERAFTSFDPLARVSLPSKPRLAIYVKPIDEAPTGEEGERPPPRIGTPRPKDDHEYDGGMSVCVGNIDVDDELFDVSFCLVVNNVVRGAWGAALLNAEYWHALMTKEKEAIAGRIEC